MVRHPRLLESHRAIMSSPASANSRCSPLCIEDLDIQDRNFHPCPCGYQVCRALSSPTTQSLITPHQQVCQFCFNNIKNNMNGLCPACRRPYDEKTIQWKVVTHEE